MHDLNNSFEKTKEEFQGHNINDFAKFILFQFQKQNRFDGIINLIYYIDKELKEYKMIVSNKNEFFSLFCKIHECSIQINKLIAATNQINSPTILNIKIKFIDILIYLILKNNFSLLSLKEDYTPNKYFLMKVLKKLEKIESIKKVNEKIKFIKELINKNKTIKQLQIFYLK